MCYKQMGWALVAVSVCGQGQAARATRSLDLYELSMFMCICWGRRGRKRLLREQIIPLRPQLWGEERLM